jgi:hypothetical protein
MGWWVVYTVSRRSIMSVVVVSGGYKLSEAEGSFIRGFSVFI